MRKNNQYKSILILLLMFLCWSGIFLFARRNVQDKLIFKDFDSYNLDSGRDYSIFSDALEERVAAYQSPIDFESLWAVNEDVIGWITIPGTRIDYPILHTDDNDTYLHQSLEREDSQYGSIYLDFQSQPDFSGWHSVLYGHNMRNGSMFHDIVNFKDKDYYDVHQEIYIYTPDREIKLRPVAVFPIRAYWWIRMTEFADEEAFLTYAETLTGYHKFGEVDLEGVTGLYTFITCSYEWEDTRTLLVAVEVE